MKLAKEQAKQTTNKTKTEILAPHDNENLLQWGHQCQHGIKKQNLEKVKQAGEFAQCIPRSASHTRKFGLGTDLRQRKLHTSQLHCSLWLKQFLLNLAFISYLSFLRRKLFGFLVSCKLKRSSLTICACGHGMWLSGENSMTNIPRQVVASFFFFRQINLYSRTHSHIGREIYCSVSGAGKIKLAKTFEKGDKQF